ncbi:undecaprenyl-diphosphate phosphatase [Salsipaludibacter albus]|uniref:undecaprenyl-diphosphate phosphatase n=1 Tax=Salsipaludibacter albus TaxID=2849650 RepID=UPI001EE4CAF6|nr:undecaprenyl-diphosphate phosphatase [Salsipaludibacter albus]MBY5162004.1 undecaprenyl-diphosphate phosphatase [Salsipaludibacter albus]
MLSAILLGIIQGLTEFLPVSSSGHLQIIPYLFGLEPGPLAFDVAVHVGTLLAVVAYFWVDLWELGVGALGLGERTPERVRRARLELGLLAVASVPAAVVGWALSSTFEERFGDPRLAAVMLFVTAGLLLGAERLYARRSATGRVASNGRDAITMGLAQSLAIIPGISRSGATIAAGMATGLTRAAAARFSFLMSIPVILGAFVLELPELSEGALAGTGYTPADVVAGTVAAAISGYVAVRFLMRLVTNDTLRGFAWYVIALGTITLLASPFIQ